MVTCDFAFLADFAAERGGFITAHGVGIDSLMAATLPASHPHLYLVIQFRCPVKELGSKNLVLRLHDDKGQVVLEQTGQANFQPPAYGDSSVARLVLGFHMVMFKTFGTSVFSVELDGKKMASLPFHVLQAQVPASV
jgi:hypothetical protein